MQMGGRWSIPFLQIAAIEGTVGRKSEVWY